MKSTNQGYVVMVSKGKNMKKKLLLLFIHFMIMLSLFSEGPLNNDISSLKKVSISDSKYSFYIKEEKNHYSIIKKYNNIDIKHIRNSVGMTQVLFANYMGVSLKTVEAWEKGTNRPTGTACRLISMLENHTFEALPFVKCLS